MLDILRDTISLIPWLFSITVAIISFIAWQYYAQGGWQIRSIDFWPPDMTKNSIKIEVVSPVKDISVKDGKDGKEYPLRGLQHATLRSTKWIPAVSVHFKIVNPSIIFPEVVKVLHYLV